MDATRELLHGLIDILDDKEVEQLYNMVMSCDQPLTTTDTQA